MSMNEYRTGEGTTWDTAKPEAMAKELDRRPKRKVRIVKLRPIAWRSDDPDLGRRF